MPILITYQNSIITIPVSLIIEKWSRFGKQRSRKAIGLNPNDGKSVNSSEKMEFTENPCFSTSFSDSGFRKITQRNSLVLAQTKQYLVHHSKSPFELVIYEKN